jgi:NO-binding membrane sensor protein with MHYT domain
MEYNYKSKLGCSSCSGRDPWFLYWLSMTTGINRVSAISRRLRILLGSLGIGGGIWLMHFISMLAVILPIELSYDVTQTAYRR